MPEALRYLERLIDVNGGCLPPPKNNHKQYRYKHGRDGRVYSIRNVDHSDCFRTCPHNQTNRILQVHTH